MHNEIDILLQRVGPNIRKCRVLRDHKQIFLAEKIEISVVTLSKIENGSIDIGVSTLFKISKIMNIELESLFHDPGEMIH